MPLPSSLAMVVVPCRLRSAALPRFAQWRARALTAALPISLLLGMLSAPLLAGATEQQADIARLLPQHCYHIGHYRQQTVADGFDEVLLSSGTFVFSCKQGLIWAVMSPQQDVWIYPRTGKPQQRIAAGLYTEPHSRIQRELGALLNHLMGGDVAYLGKYFSAVPLADGVRLRPRKQRMSKFIEAIELVVDDEHKVMTLMQPMQRMVITIVADQRYDTLNASICSQQLNALADACAQLFQ